MTWNGISFYIHRSELIKMRKMPEAIITSLTDINGLSDTVKISYPFKYAPNGWQSWQAIAAFKYQIQSVFKSAIFDVLEQKHDEGWTVGTLGKHLNEIVTFPKPYYPQVKGELNSRLVIYAMRLHFNGLLYYESLFAMALHFNSKTGSSFSSRELSKKSASIMKIDKSEWKVKLDEQQKDESNKSRAQKASLANKQKGDLMFNRFKELLPSCTKDNGKLDVCLLMSELDVSRAMIYKLKARL